MRRFLARSLTVMLIAVLASHAAPQSPSDQQAEHDLLALANRARADAGFSPLQPDEGLAKAALQHAKIMAARRQLSHQFPGEQGLMQRIAGSSDLRVDQAAENVGQADSAEEVHGGFMASPPHRANLLNPAYNSVGIAVVRSGSMLYVVQDFAHRVASYSSEQAENLIAQAINRIRDEWRFAAAGAEPQRGGASAGLRVGRGKFFAFLGAPAVGTGSRHFSLHQFSASQLAGCRSEGPARSRLGHFRCRRLLFAFSELPDGHLLGGAATEMILCPLRQISHLTPWKPHTL